MLTGKQIAQLRHALLAAYPTNAALREMASRRGVAPAQLALAWMLHQPGVMALPKSARALHLQQNWDAAALKLDAATLEGLDAAFPAPRTKQPLAVG